MKLNMMQACRLDLGPPNYPVVPIDQLEPGTRLEVVPPVSQIATDRSQWLQLHLSRTVGCRPTGSGVRRAGTRRRPKCPTPRIAATSQIAAASGSSFDACSRPEVRGHTGWIGYAWNGATRQGHVSGVARDVPGGVRAEFQLNGPSDRLTTYFKTISIDVN